jgi:2-polyprenyl-6-hydroxyphenyl methylase/3-demethylubiquinone-9 3-methyltransferase
MEVLEHVADINSFVGACSQALKPGGAFVGATLNRTLRSLAMAKVGAEYILRWLPIGTHDWNKFLTPAEVTRALREAGLTIEVIQGATYQPLSGQWALTSDTGVNYMFSAHKGA